MYSSNYARWYYLWPSISQFSLWLSRIITKINEGDVVKIKNSFSIKPTIFYSDYNNYQTIKWILDLQPTVVIFTYSKRAYMGTEISNCKLLWISPLLWLVGQSMLHAFPLKNNVQHHLLSPYCLYLG